MRILFNKNVPYPLRRHFAEHEVITAAEMGWGRLVNGLLLQAAEDDGFDLMVTADQSLSYQQNLSNRRIALVVLSTNHIRELQTQADKLVAAVNAATESSYEFVRFELPPRPDSKKFIE